MKKNTPNCREVSPAGFETFKNGIFNCRPPWCFNWDLGYSVTPLKSESSRLQISQALPTKRINGQFIST